MNYGRFEELVELITVVGPPEDKKRSFKYICVYWDFLRLSVNYWVLIICLLLTISYLKDRWLLTKKFRKRLKSRFKRKYKTIKILKWKHWKTKRAKRWLLNRLQVLVQSKHQKQNKKALQNNQNKQKIQETIQSKKRRMNNKRFPL